MEKSPYMNPDGTFKGGFDGCVLHMTRIEGHSEESARKICGSIAQHKLGNRVDGLVPILNREGNLPDDHWVHLVPRGEYPHPETGKLQVIDGKALDAIANNFRPKILVDQEHWSYDPERSSEAFAWVEAVDVRADGIWGKIELTDLGTAAIQNKRYRYLSPAWLPRDVETVGKERIRPLRLDTVGFTNSPNLRGMVPLFNRQGASAALAVNQNPQQRTATMKSIATKLGLAAEASEDAILAEVTKVITNRDDLARQLKETEPFKNRIAELETQVGQLTDEQIDQDLDGHGIKDEAKRAELKPVLKPMKNREARVKFLTTCIGGTAGSPGGAGNRPLTNRGKAKTPDTKAPSDTGEEADQAVAREREKEVREYALRNRCSNTEAWDAVRRDRPELFGIVRN